MDNLQRHFYNFLGNKIAVECIFTYKSSCTLQEYWCTHAHIHGQESGIHRTWKYNLNSIIRNTRWIEGLFVFLYFLYFCVFAYLYFIFLCFVFCVFVFIRKYVCLTLSWNWRRIQPFARIRQRQIWSRDCSTWTWCLSASCSHRRSQ